jgi:glycyl-tRNA synthetase beta chain
VMGGIYARLDGESDEVAEAIYEQYRPAGAGDALAVRPEGRLLALADRLDTLVGYFALGAEPTGTRDPFALRRAGLAVVRLLMEGAWSISLRSAIEAAAARYPGDLSMADDAVERLVAFLRERARFVSQAAGHRYDSIGAVLSAQADDLHDADLRLQALTALRADPQHEEAFRSLSSAFKRIRNLTKGHEEGDLDPGALVEPPELELHRSLEQVEQQVEQNLRAPDYLAALRAIASLRPAVDGFLGSSRDEGVLVMAPDPRLRDNRLALLRRAGRLFTRIADFSEIVVEGKGVESAGAAPAGRAR